MKKSVVALALLLGAPLAAQSFEVGLFLGQQQYPSPHVDWFPGVTLQNNLDNKTVYGARFAYSVVDLGPSLIQLTAGYQPEVKSTVNSTLGGSPAGQYELKQSHWSIGAMFNFKAVVAVGAGLEYRSEKLSDESDSTTYNRPWIRANVGYAIHSPLVKPFFGVEVAFPLTSKKLELSSSNADALKSMAPKSQFGIYAGIRF
jgi:hypothetical protein